jgi:hypothetical protein
MPLLEITASKKITAIVALEDSTAKQIDQYATFTKGSADDVVNAALEYVFGKDKDFQRYREENANAKPLIALRIKRPVVIAAKPATKPAEQKPVAAAVPAAAR